LLEPKTAIGIWLRCAVDAGEFPGVRTCGKTRPKKPINATTFASLEVVPVETIMVRFG
jgi:hypothetical protein